MSGLPGMGPPTLASGRRLSVIARTGNAQIRVTGWAACEVAQMGERSAARSQAPLAAALESRHSTPPSGIACRV
jgi:hypothetical protein